LVLVASTSLQTDSAQPFPGLDSKLTVIRPVPYLAAFVISSLAINPSETFALKQYLEEGLLLTHIRAMFGSPVTPVPSEVINLGVKVHPHDHIGKAGRFCLGLQLRTDRHLWESAPQPS
jgi:hypothetical protein